MTSHDVVNVMRRKLRIKKIGHTVTLDPEATGLLVLLIGKQAIIKSVRFISLEKRYRAVMTLGIKTETADHTGRILSRKAVPHFSESRVHEVFEKFEGESMQVPPMVCAKKISGRKLYELAREGISVARKPVKIKISELTIERIELPQIHFSLLCSKGTYVRTLCEDMGEAFGCGAHMSWLRRIQIGNFNVENAMSVGDIKEASHDEISESILET